MAMVNLLRYSNLGFARANVLKIEDLRPPAHDNVELAGAFPIDQSGDGHIGREIRPMLWKTHISLGPDGGFPGVPVFR